MGAWRVQRGISEEPMLRPKALPHLIELKELLLLLQGLCVGACLGRGQGLGRLGKAVVAICVRPLQDAPAVHNL